MSYFFIYEKTHFVCRALGEISMAPLFSSGISLSVLVKSERTIFLKIAEIINFVIAKLV